MDLAHELSLGPLPDVEGVQDIVERVLFDTAFFKSAKAYILYREQHAQIRAIAAKASVDLVDSYIKKLDWKMIEGDAKCNGAWEVTCSSTLKRNQNPGRPR